jgi:hypothetical protein
MPSLLTTPSLVSTSSDIIKSAEKLQSIRPTHDLARRLASRGVIKDCSALVEAGYDGWGEWQYEGKLDGVLCGGLTSRLAGSFYYKLIPSFSYSSLLWTGL